MSKIVFIDIETAGPTTDYAVTEIAVIQGWDRSMFSSKVLPYEKKYDEKAMSVSGITMDSLKRSGIELSEVAKGLGRIFDRADKVVAYNAPFDHKHVNAILKQFEVNHSEVEWLCALRQAKDTLALDSYKLADVADYFGISKPTHRALDDTKVLEKVYYKLLTSDM